MSIAQSLFGGGNFPSQPTASGTTVATTEFPKELAPFIKDILEKSKAMQAGASYQPYTGAQIAPFNPLEQEAMSALEAQTRGLAGTDVAQAAPYFTGAKTAIEGLGQQFTGDTAQQFMNPYQQAVTDQAKLKATEDYEAQQNVLAANAIKNQPFGGSRQAITEGMAQGDYLDRLSNIQERGLSSAYTQGRSAFEAQKGRELQMANQLMGMGATVPQQAYRDLGIRQQIGETQRAQDQMALDLGTKQFMEEREFPTRALQEYSATVRGFPFQPSTYTTQTSYQPQPGIGQQLVNLAGQGLGGYTAFTGQPMQNLFKAEGGITTLPTYYNQSGDNDQRPRSIYDLINTQTEEAQQFYAEQALIQEQEELDQAQQLDAMDLEYYIEEQNRPKSLIEKVGNILYAPQQGIKNLLNMYDRKQIGNRFRPNLRRAEGGITSLPVYYNIRGDNPHLVKKDEHGGRYKLNEFGDRVYLTETEEGGGLKYPLKWKGWSEENAAKEPYLYNQGWGGENNYYIWGADSAKKAWDKHVLEGLNIPTHSLPEDYDLSDNTQELIAAGSHYMHPKLGVMPMPPSVIGNEVSNYVEEGGYPLEAALVHPDLGIPKDIPGYSVSPELEKYYAAAESDPELLNGPLVYEELDQNMIGNIENIPPDIKTEMLKGVDVDSILGDERVTSTENKIYQEYLDKYLDLEGPHQNYLKVLNKLLTPEYKAQELKQADQARALSQGLGMMKAFSSSDPTRGIISNLSSQIGQFADEAGQGEQDYLSTLSDIEDIPLSTAQQIFSTEKDVLELVKPASDEKSGSLERTLKADLFNTDELMKLVKNDATLKEGSKERNVRIAQINVLKELENDKNLLQLYTTELDYLKNKETIQGALAKANQSLLDKGILTPKELKYGETELLDIMFGKGKYTFNENNDIVSVDGNYMGDIKVQEVFDKYRGLIGIQMAKYRMYYLTGDSRSRDDEGMLNDWTLTSIQPILDRAKIEYNNLNTTE